MENNTIFDDVFQTIKEKMPELVIPLINEAFGTTYALDVPILRGENEHYTANGKIITDSYLIIGSRKYHLECQSTEYRAIERYLEKIFLQKGQEKSFRDMMELINRITGYIFSKSEKIKEGLGEIMGGQVLELESDRLIKKGEQIGLARGSIEKLAELVAKRMRKGDTAEQIAELLEEDLELIQKIYTVIQQNGIDCEPSIICEKVLEK